MIHTVTIARRVSRPKMEEQGINLFEAEDVSSLLSGNVTEIQASTRSYTGINEIKAYDENVKYFTEHKEKLDLDNGVAFNYRRLEKILYKEPKITKSKED